MQKPKSELSQWAQRCAVGLTVFGGIALSKCFDRGFQFSWHDLQIFFLFVGLLLTVGWSSFQCVRYGIRFLLSKMPMSGYGIAFVGLVATIAPLTGLFLLVRDFARNHCDAATRHEMAPAIVMALMAGMLGGAFGSWDAGKTTEKSNP